MTRVAYLKAITSRHAPDALLPWTAHALLHGASHRGVRDLLLDGGAAGALRAVAPLLVPLRLRRWADTLPSARDVEGALRDAEADAARAAAAAGALEGAGAGTAGLLTGPPPPPPGVAELRRLGLGDAPPGGFVLPPPTLPSLSQQQAEAGDSVVGAAATGAAADQLPRSRVAPLNAFCFSPEARPGAAALSRARARLALPGSDVPPAEDAAQRAALRRALADQRRAATRLPLWFVHGEAGVCGELLRDLAAELPMPAFGLELGDSAAGVTAAAAPPPPPPPGALQLLAARHAEALLAVQPCGPHVLVGLSPYSCLLAAAIASELERGGVGAGGGGAGSGGSSSGSSGGVALILVNGAPALPARLALPPPQAYAAFALCADAAAAAGGSAAQAPAFRAFAAEFAAAAAAAARASGARGAHDAALRELAARRRPSAPAAAAAAWDAAVASAARAASLMARLCAGYSPEYVVQGPAVLVLAGPRADEAEDPESAALLEAARENCSGALSLLPPPPAVAGGHGERLASAAGRAALAAALSDALTELIMLV